MSDIQPKWVRFRDRHGPMYKGDFPYVAMTTDRWDKILGVIAECEGNFDTVVMYDGTGVTFGFMQWSFTSGRLQKLLEHLKTVPHDPYEKRMTLFDWHCEDASGMQVFENFGFKIEKGGFVSLHDGVLDPGVEEQKDLIDDCCLGRIRFPNDEKSQKIFSVRLCKLFAEMGCEQDIQIEQVLFAKNEIIRSLDIRREALEGFCNATIRSMLPEFVWQYPIPAVFFNLWQNSPGGTYKLFKKFWTIATNKKMVNMSTESVIGTDTFIHEIFDVLWRLVCGSSYADWGFKSKQYIESGGRNPPRVLRIKSAIEEYYPEWGKVELYK